ncbi:MAG TPA: DUF3471 domain-containing protein [Bryobacteraceae bacterium]|jgi:hypothetical protein
MIRICIALTAFGTTLAAQWLNYPAPGIPRLPDGKPSLLAPTPRMPDGKPDLSGLWKTVRGGKYGLNVAADLKLEEIQPWARALARKHMEDQGDGVNCLPAGPQVGGIVTVYKFVQTPALIIILHEAGTGDAFRQVFTDGRPLPKDPSPSWYGYSVGRWDGDALQIDTIGFNDKTVLDAFRHPHTEALHITERLRRRDFGHIELQQTYEDPGAYARPWTITLNLELDPDNEVLEYFCNENERDLAHRVPHRHVVVPATVLAGYVGTYRMSTGREITITAEDDQLMVEQDARGKLPLFAHSQTSFVLELAALGLNSVEFEFVPDDRGGVAKLVRRAQGVAEVIAARKEP